MSKCERSATHCESPDEWYERERAAFIAWWESEGQKKFSETPTLAAGAGWLARAEAASENDACRAALANIMACIAEDEFIPTEYKEDARKALLAPSATSFIEPEWKMDSAPLHWPYSEREAWKGGYYAAMKAFQKAQSGQ